MTKYLINEARKSASLRLFCFHFAGGGASCFNGWAKVLGEDIAVCPIQLPGRESRFREPRITNFNDLIERLYYQLESNLDRPYAFYGHSLGALIAYAIAYRRYQLGLRLPQILFVGAHRAPHIPYSFPSCHSMSFDDLKALLSKFEGVPESILRNEEWMEILLPLIKDDLLLCESYEHQLRETLPCPIYAFGGTSDLMVSQREILAWSQHTKAEFKSYFYPEGHFFIKSQGTQLPQAIKLAIQQNFSAHLQSSAL
jgi:medium-chain acyl-[acyl-carrier-protein] hydrolase